MAFKLIREEINAADLECCDVDVLRSDSIRKVVRNFIGNELSVYASAHLLGIILKKDISAEELSNEDLDVACDIIINRLKQGESVIYVDIEDCDFDPSISITKPFDNQPRYILEMVSNLSGYSAIRYTAKFFNREELIKYLQ